MIIINNKFNIGEEVYSIWQVPMKIKCNLCEGRGNIVYKNQKLRCPQCKGNKTILFKEYKHWEVMPERLIIGSIKTTINNSMTNIRYKVSGYNRQEQNLFKTREEAQIKCDELNYIIGS